MLQRMKNLVHDVTGQSLTEIAIIMPFALILVGGMVDVGRFAYLDIAVAGAARAGVQYGSQSIATANDSSGMSTAANNEAPNVSGLTITPTTRYCKCSNGSSCSLQVSNGTSSWSCDNGATALFYVKVIASASLSPLIHYPGLPSSITVTRTAVMQILQS